MLYHSMGNDEGQRLRYTPLTGSETVMEPEYDETDIRVVGTVTPPYTEGR